MGLFDAIIAIIKAVSAYFQYQYDPAQIARRDEINKQLAEENGYDSVETFLGKSDTVNLSVFISEYLRRMRPQETDSATGRAADLLIGVLPKPRNQKSRDADPTEGLSG